MASTGAGSGLTKEQLLEMLLRQTPDHAVVLIGLDGRIEHWLGASERIFGYGAAEMEGQSAEVLFTEEDRQRGLPALELEEALRSPRADDDRWHVRRDGTRIWVSGSVIVLRDEQGRVVCYAKVVRDLTDRRAYVETLENRLQDLANVKAYKEVAVTTLAHELRNPLAPLYNAVQLIRLTPGMEAIAHPLRIIDRQLEALRRLVDDLADAGRIATGKLRLQLERVDLAVLLEEVADGMRAEFAARHLTLELIVPSVPIHLELDRGRFQQALTNLLTNALRYTPAGGTVWVKATVEPNLVVVRVRDTGIGLSAETLPFIFNLFTRSPSAEVLAPGGMGIGLALVKQIVELHGGSLDVRSEGAGKGSVFSMRLPLEQRSSEPLLE